MPRKRTGPRNWSKINVELPPELEKWLSDEAQATGESRNAVVVRILAEAKSDSKAP